ncbi:MAG: hypothetical protein ABEJ31_02685 [Haloarculaceae archaeon]
MARTLRDWIAWLSPGLIILVGVVLFFIPAPPTSMLGIGLILVGAVLWIVDYFGGESSEPTGRREVEPRGETR